MSLFPIHAFRRCSASRLCKGEQFLSLFHTSSSGSKQHTPRKRPKVQPTTAPSRTRLAKSLKPASSSGSIEVAPRLRKTEPEQEPSFSRDSVPHVDVPPKQERNPSFRRRSKRRSEQDWNRRVGRWELDRKDQYDANVQDHTPYERWSTAIRRRPIDKSPGFGVRRDDGRRNSRLERQTSYSDQLPWSGSRSGSSKLTPEDRSRFPHQTNSSSVKSENHLQRSRSSQPSLQGAYRQPARSNHKSRQSGMQSHQSDNSLEQFAYRSENPSDRPERNKHPFETSIPNNQPPLTEFYHPPPSPVASHRLKQTGNQVPTNFTSPPLMPGLLSCLTDVLGPDSTPTPIQSLSLKWLFEGNSDAVKGQDVVSYNESESRWKQFLLASETGSGKSIAYLLPMLQSLKQFELQSSSTAPLTPPPGHSRRALNPRALVLAPTHELARQLSGFAKALLHEIKLRVLCASRANVKNSKERKGTSSKMAEEFEARMGAEEMGGEFQVHKGGRSFPVDLVVGTPMKLLEMVRGRGWDRKENEEQGVNSEETNAAEQKKKVRRGRDRMEGFGKWRSKPEMGLENVEWVVVDEADVLFDPDFQETTRLLLADISAARGKPVSFSLQSPLPPKDPAISVPSSPTPPPTNIVPIDYPFNFILTSATIPSALAAYLDKHHPKLMRLASPNLHHLPKTLQTEYVNWTGGNKNADIERRIRRVWAEDSSSGGVAGESDPERPPLSRVLVFCNKSTKVNELGEYLAQKGIKNVALTSTSDQRKRGSNHHLDGFLRQNAKGNDEDKASMTPGPDSAHIVDPLRGSNPKEEPHVMITTSLLSRGLDFSPAIRHVFIVDEPRNMIDFLHRAGRSGRAGERGKVVVFGKMKGRGSAKAKDVRRRVGSLVA